MYVLFVVILVCLNLLRSSKGDVASVVWDSKLKELIIKDGLVADSVAWANFSNQINNTGWSYLNVTTNESYKDEVQAIAAGLVEGYITDKVIYYHWINTVEGYCNKEENYCQRLKKFIDVNVEWMHKRIVDASPNDPYWHQVKLLLVQLKGLEEGYNRSVAAKRVPPLPGKESQFGLLMLELFGDLGQLELVLNRTMSRLRAFRGQVSCSALIKILPGNTDIIISQETWTDYKMMLRVLKRYHFNYHLNDMKGSGLIPGYHMSFSSYPGVLFSIDDFYLISSGLVTLETTNGNSNSDLYKYVQPESVLEWMRCMVANRLSTSGSQWANYLIRYNSGTYNNQWMIINMKLYKKKKPLADGLLWIVEHIPNYYEMADKTDLLRDQGYWPSYNIPYFPLIYKMSGFAAAAAKHGDWYTYDKTPRALIFKRDHDKVIDLRSLLTMMRYNDYTHDPLSRCNCNPPYSAVNAIASRTELNIKNGTYPFPQLGHSTYGAIDVKMTSLLLFYSGLSFIGVSGPTHDSVPVFQWSKSSISDMSHVGQPDVWQFEPVVFGPHDVFPFHR